MKGRTIGGAVMALGLLLILTPWVIFPVCGVGRFAPAGGAVVGHHGCHGTLRAETALGIAAIVAAMFPLLWPRQKTTAGASAAALIIAVLAALFPTVITGMCGMPTMACRMGTLPALITVSILMGITAGVGLLVSRQLP